MHRLTAVVTILMTTAGCARAEESPAVASDDAALQRAHEILRTAPVFDGHNDLPWAIRIAPDHPRDVAAFDLGARTPFHTDLPRLREGGVAAQWWSVYVPGEVSDSGYAKMQLEQIDIARRIIESYPDHLELALTAADVERIMRAGRIASLIGMEGGHVLENSLGALRAYYDLGARYLTLTHNVTLDWADAASALPRHDGLTEFGREVVREMNRLGMLVDLSHVAPSTMSDALDVTEAPIIFSHSSARALTDVPRNVPDSILRRMPQNGGVVMVTFVPAFISQEVADFQYRVRPRLELELQQELQAATSPADRDRITSAHQAANPPPRSTIGQVADHIEHIRDIAGIDHVGIGGDYDGVDDLPVGMEDVSTYPVLFAELIRRGWDDADLTKLSSGNMMRVLRRAEEVSARLRGERPPSVMTCC